MAKTATKERGILMHKRSTEGIRAERKTQTRRIIRGMPPTIYAKNLTDGVLSVWPSRDDMGETFKCPYGQPGDRLWVRETWATLKEYDHLPPRDVPVNAGVWYAADDPFKTDRVAAGRTRSSLHMPRWASRITLEITDVRVERVQNISPSDCLSEGIDPSVCHDWGGYYRDRVTGELYAGGPNEGSGSFQYPEKAVEEFQRLWDDTNGKGAWERNDWVWVVCFKRLGADDA
jgi:hypothetical protein